MARSRNQKISERIAQQKFKFIALALIVVALVGSISAWVDAKSIESQIEQLSKYDLLLSRGLWRVRAEHARQACDIDRVEQVVEQQGLDNRESWKAAVALLKNHNHVISETLSAINQQCRNATEVNPEYAPLVKRIHTLSLDQNKLFSATETMNRLFNEGREGDMLTICKATKQESDMFSKSLDEFWQHIQYRMIHGVKDVRANTRMLFSICAIFSFSLIGWALWSVHLLMSKKPVSSKPYRSRYGNHATKKKATPAAASTEVSKPETATSQAASGGAKRSSGSQSLRGYHLLLAEDGTHNQRLISAVLTSVGARVDIAKDGQEAVEKVKQADLGSGSYDLVLMDTQMPMLDGHQALNKIRDNGSRIPAIALSTHDFDGVREKCLEDGFIDCVMKPINREEFVELVAIVLSRQAIESSMA